MRRKCLICGKILLLTFAISKNHLRLLTWGFVCLHFVFFVSNPTDDYLNRQVRDQKKKLLFSRKKALILIFFAKYLCIGNGLIISWFLNLLRSLHLLVSVIIIAKGWAEVLKRYIDLKKKNLIKNRKTVLHFYFCSNYK